MKRTQAMLLALLALVALAVLWLARSNRVPPALPGDRVHAEAAGPGACLSCHGPGGAHPRPRSHPPGQDCWRCHAARAGR